MTNQTRVKRDAALKVNPLIGSMGSGDTMCNVAAVLMFLSNIQYLDGILPEEESEYGRGLLLDTCRNALMFEVSTEFAIGE